MSAENPTAPIPVQPSASKPAKWVLKKPGSTGVNRIKAFGRTISITNEKLKDPAFIEYLGKVEVLERIQVFGTIVVRG